jgi:prepilin-type processing-associated H-X9-DG protein
MWLSWKRHGDAGMAARIEAAVANADYLRQRIAAIPAFIAAHPGGPCNVLFCERADIDLVLAEIEAVGASICQ